MEKLKGTARFADNLSFIFEDFNFLVEEDDWGPPPPIPDLIRI